MAINKVIYGGGTLIDLTTDTVTAETLKTGVTAHDKAGNQITGTFDTTTGSVHQDDDGYVVINDGDDTGIAFLPLNVTSNGTYVADSNAGYTPVTVDVHNELQNKSVTPTESPQAVVPDSGYDGMGRVDVAAISSTYVGTGIARKSANDIVVSGSTVTTPAGYFPSAVSAHIRGGTLTPLNYDVSPRLSVDSNGLITANAKYSFTFKPIAESGYFSTGDSVIYSVGDSKTYQLSIQSAITITPTTATQLAVSSGYFTTGSIYVDRMPEGSLSDVSIGTGRVGEVTIGTSALGVLSPAISVDPATGLVRASFSSTISGIKPVATAGYISADATHTITAFGSNALQLNVQPAKVITPSEASQIAISSGYYATGSVVVDAIPSNYIIPSGDYTISSNGYYEVPEYYGVSVNVAPKLQSKSVTPSETAKTVLPDTGYDGLSQVGVNAISNTYVGTSVPRLTSADAIIDTSYGSVIIPSGYFQLSRNYVSVSEMSYYNNLISYRTFTMNYNVEVAVQSSVFGNLTSIARGAFCCFSNLRTTEFTSCERVGSYAFMGATIYDTETVLSFPVCSSAELEAFASMPSRTGKSLLLNLPSLSKLPERICCSNTALVSFYAESATNVPYSAFYRCTLLTTVSIPLASHVLDYAFEYCIKLESVYFPECLHISYRAFGFCSSLSTVNFPKCTFISGSAFYSCSSLRSISFPECITIGASAFQSCISLSTANFPKCTTISMGAFSSCYSLATVNFPVCTTISNYAFANCSSLSLADFPKCETVGQSAFASCSSLRVISFPKCTSMIGATFISCSALESAYFLGSSVPTLNNNPFIRTPMSESSYLGYFGSIFIRQSLLQSFISSTYWGVYSSRFVGLTDAEIAALDAS